MLAGAGPSGRGNKKQAPVKRLVLQKVRLVSIPVITTSVIEISIA